jgi:hypothetical protein
MLGLKAQGCGFALPKEKPYFTTFGVEKMEHFTPLLLGFDGVVLVQQPSVCRETPHREHRYLLS